MPKSRIGFRVSTQLDPLDSLLYAAVLYEFADEVEEYRVPSELEIVCSYRIKIQATGALFEHETGWPTFHKRSVDLADSGRFTHVLVADVADFYNQVSHHRVNNVLQSAGVPTDRTKNIERFLSLLSAKQSRGLPVGPSASIALAEASLDDVDKYLLSRRLEYVRYVDDFRIFCESEKQAIHAAHDLTHYLYTAHRLALAAAKTSLYTVRRFVERELLDPGEEEERGKVSKLKDLIQQVLENTGYQIDFEELPESDLNDIVRDNLAELFLQALARRPLHLGLTRYLLRRAKQLRTTILRMPVLENLAVLTPAMREVIEYLIVGSKPGEFRETGTRLLDFALNGASGPLPFVRLWILEFFIRRPGSIGYLDALRIATESRDSLGMRPTALLAKAYDQVQWVRSQKEQWANHSPWDRRAIIWSATVLPDDERRHWCGMVRDTTSDPLDRAVAISSAQG